MNHDGPPNRHLHPVEPPYDPEYDGPHTTPLYDNEAERAVLATLINTPTTADTIAANLNPSDFYRPEHEAIYNTWHHLNNTDGTPPDPIVLNTELARTRNTNAIRALTDIVLTTTIPQHLDRYITSVRDHARIRTARTAYTQLGRQLNAATPTNLDQAFGDALDTIQDATLRFAPTHQGPTPWTPLDLEPVLRGEEVDPPPTLLHRTDGNNLLYQGAVHTLSGEPGSGKTWVTLIATVQQLEAGNNVTMIDFEDRASRVIARLLALGATPPQIRDQFHYIRPRTALDNTTRPALDQATTGSTLVILDGVTEAMTLHGYDLNANADVATFYDLLPRHIADTTGATVVLIDHVVKDGEKQGRWALGGQHKLAGIDGVAYLVKAIEPFGRGKTGKARITVSKDRPGYIEELALGRTVAELHLNATDVNVLRYHLDPPAPVTKDEAGNMRPTHLMEKVSRWLELTPGASRTQIETGVTGKVTYLRRAIDRLVQEGYVEVATGPRNTQLHRVINPFREHEEEPQEERYA